MPPDCSEIFSMKYVTFFAFGWSTLLGCWSNNPCAQHMIKQLLGTFFLLSKEMSFSKFYPQNCTLETHCLEISLLLGLFSELETLI